MSWLTINLLYLHINTISIIVYMSWIFSLQLFLSFISIIDTRDIEPKMKEKKARRTYSKEEVGLHNIKCGKRAWNEMTIITMEISLSFWTFFIQTLKTILAPFFSCSHFRKPLNWLGIICFCRLQTKFVYKNQLKKNVFFNIN